MSDNERELADLKREVVEARNQTIRSDNQVKNLVLDIKGFDKRFDGLEARARVASIGVHLIVAVTLGIAAYAVSSVRDRASEHEIATLQATLKEEHEAAQGRVDELRARLSEVEKKRRLHDQASEVAAQMHTLLEARQETEAGALLGKLEIAQLTVLEQQLMGRRLADLRHREADLAYRAGRTNVLQNRPEAAVADLRRSLELEADGRQTGQVRYLLAVSLYGARRYEEAEPLLKELSSGSDRTVMDEARFYQAACQARLGRVDQARAQLTSQAAEGGRFAVAAKFYLAALAAGTELPTDLPGGRVRVAPRSAPAAAVAAPPAAAAAVAAVPSSPTPAGSAPTDVAPPAAAQ